MRAIALPKWLMLHYAKLWTNMKEDSFSFGVAHSLINTHRNKIYIIMSRLRSNGWIVREYNQLDGRKANYKCKTPETCVLEIANI